MTAILNSSMPNMYDKHLNLFYSYNRDIELIEDNLTRAFAVTLSLLSPSTALDFLSQLVFGYKKDIDSDSSPFDLDIDSLQIALQGNIDPAIPRSSEIPILLIISTDLLNVNSLLAFDADLLNTDLSLDPSSRPDAWIYHDQGAYCILIEVKVGNYPINNAQLSSHVRDWFGLKCQDLYERSAIISRTWIQVLEILEIIANDTDVSFLDRKLLSHLVEFITYYGYSLFRGVQVEGLDDPPGNFVFHGLKVDLSIFPSWVDIQPPPSSEALLFKTIPKE